MTDSQRTPVDEASRRAIRDNIKATLFVTAGAGSGKTRELVKRIAGLVLAGVPLPRIAAITFTNAAAAELRDRVRLELEQAAAGQGDYAALDEGQREMVSDAIRAIDSASIQTLHSFAQRILALYPIEAGLPPELAVRDEVAASISFEDRWQPFMERLFADGCDDPAVASGLIRGFSTNLLPFHLRAIAMAFHQQWDRVLDTTFERPPMPRIDATAVLDHLRDAFDMIDHVLPGFEDDHASRAMAALRPLWESVKYAQNALDAVPGGDERLVAEESLMSALNAEMKAIWRGRAENWRRGSLGRLKTSVKDAIAARDELLNGVRMAALGPLLGTLQHFVREYRDERIDSGSLEFHDVLILCRDLLRDHPAVRSRLRARYQALLIDEFQDTDPLQVEIAVLLASSDNHAPGRPWHQFHVEPGRLFFVGDPKQSIYRFRNADIDLYTSAARRFGATPLGETVLLTQNFRSQPSLIAWVNNVFADLFRLDRAPGQAAVHAAQVQFDPLTSWREAKGEVAVHLLGGPQPFADVKLLELRAMESRAVADAVAAIRAGGGEWQVADDRLTGWREPRFRDVAILMPTRAALSFVEQALNEAGIPCRIESRSLLFETQEVRDLLSILSAIDDPTDQVAVVAALRAPGFGCSDRDLHRFIAARGSWNYLNSLPQGYPAGDIVALAMWSLKSLHEKRWWVDIGSMVDLVIRELRLFQVAYAGRRTRESWQRLRFVHEQARAFAGAGGRNLRQFVQFMERQADEQARVVETAVAEADDDAVRIMTVHASKGLEFPIVILTGLNTKPASLSPVLLHDSGGQPQVRVGSQDRPFETPGYAAIRERELLMERIEGDRLLYVAATRARDHLLVSVFHQVGHTPGTHEVRHRNARCTPAECLYEISQGHPASWRQLDPPPAGAGWIDAPSREVSATVTDREEWIATRNRLIADSARAPVLAATAIAKAAGSVLAQMPEDSRAEPTGDDAPWKKGRGGTSLGRAVHAVLQTIDLATGEGLAAAARAQATAEGIEPRFAEIVELAEAARASDAVQAAVASGRFWREVYVSAALGEAMIEGFIDLLYETSGGLVVVDYKTDSALNAAAIDASMARYRLQGAAYALALQIGLSRPVTRCTFVFVQPRQERDIVDLEAAMEEVRQAVPAALLASTAQLLGDTPFGDAH